jgi:LacI family transcriptional regulator
VIGQLLHNEFGIPVEPSLTTIPAKLIEGPTLRLPVATEAATAGS